MNMNREPQSSRFPSNIAEQEILQRLVIGGWRLGAFDVHCINSPRARFLGLVKIELTQISGFEFDGHRAVPLLLFERRGDDCFQVFIKRRWQR